MPSRFALRLSLLLAVLALPADAVAASSVRTFSVTGRVVAATGRPSTLSLACPPGAVALNAAVTRQGAGVVVRRSIPGKGSGDWAFRVAAEGLGSRAVSAVLRCVALQLPDDVSHARLDVRTRDRSAMALAPGEARTTQLGCGSRWSATGYALDAGSSGEVRLAGAVPSAHGWRFTLENTGTSSAMAGVSVRCIRSTVAATRSGGGSAEMRFAVTRRSFSTVFPPGRGQIDAPACRAGRFSLAAGGELDPASPRELVIAAPTRQRRGRWKVTGGNAAGDPFTGHAVCLGTGTRFR